MVAIKDVTTYLESKAPLAYQESYDNSGLITGDPNQAVTGILITLDCTELVVAEAIRKGYNLIVAHHPIIFTGLKKITGQNYVERTVLKAIKNDIAIYAIHTNLDNVINGVNYKIAEKIGLQNVEVLSRKKDVLKKITTFVPQNHTEPVLKELYRAGAGSIGDYKNCSFKVSGNGTFEPNEKAKPFVGKVGQVEYVHEDRVEVIFPAHIEANVVAALKKSHPYETPAYFLHALSNTFDEVGSGAIGFLPGPLPAKEFLELLKSKLKLNCIRYTELSDKQVHKIALCGGAGSFLLKNAIGASADVFITADFKYHEFFDADGKIIIADIGHYESEVFTKELIYDFILEKFTNFAVDLSEIITNPISYL